MNLRELIRSRDQAEWRAAFNEWITNTRIFVQENGEKALILGFLLGIFIVMLFKLFIFVACFAALGYLLVMVIAEPPNKGPSGT
jgi:hypothetical protein